MIESVQFRNFKALRDTTLPLSRFTLIVGPNGSGKSTALQALQAAAEEHYLDFHKVVTAGLELDHSTTIEVTRHFREPRREETAIWPAVGHPFRRWTDKDGGLKEQAYRGAYMDEAYMEGRRPKNSCGFAIYSFDASAISAGERLQQNARLDSNGGNLAVVLDQLNNRESERFERLNDEMGRWLPEFDRILFDTTGEGRRGLLLRTREGHFQIPATELSQGTLLALAMLTLAYIPEPPPIVCLEEPDRGIHPRLLREVRDAMYRLSYPENYGDERDPVQVVATTHSPYLLDLFKDHPEEVVIANKVNRDVRFERLSDREDLDEILGDAQLGDVWYSGILGGVPAHP